MLDRILHVGQRIKLQEFARSGQVLSTGVQVHFELIELPPEVSFTLLLGAAAQESWVDREVDLQVELQLLANKVLLA